MREQSVTPVTASDSTFQQLSINRLSWGVVRSCCHQASRVTGFWVMAVGGWPSTRLYAVCVALSWPDSYKSPSRRRDTPNSRRLTTDFVPVWSSTAWQAEGQSFDSVGLREPMGTFVGRSV